MDRSVIHYVKEMQAGNEQAFTELYRAIYDDVFRMVYSHVHNQADAKDVTQEVFISLYHNINHLKDPEAFPLWIQRVVFTRCTRLFRKRKDSLMSESLRFRNNLVHLVNTTLCIHNGNASGSFK